MPAERTKRRPGFLSDSDLAYLDDPAVYIQGKARQSVDEREAAIHERLRFAAIDFSELMDRRDGAAPFIRDVFARSGQRWTSSSTADPTPRPTRAIDRGLMDLIRFGWLAAGEAGFNPERFVERALEGLLEAENPGRRAEVDLRTELHTREADAELAKLKLVEGEDLTDADREAVLEDDAIREVLAEYLAADE